MLKHFHYSRLDSHMVVDLGRLWRCQIENVLYFETVSSAKSCLPFDLLVHCSPYH